MDKLQKINDLLEEACSQAGNAYGEAEDAEESANRASDKADDAESEACSAKESAESAKEKIEKAQELLSELSTPEGDGPVTFKEAVTFAVEAYKVKNELQLILNSTNAKIDNLFNRLDGIINYEDLERTHVYVGT